MDARFQRPEKPGKTLTLAAKTHKGKNKLREAGTDQWRIVRVDEKLICFQGRPGLHIEPIIPGDRKQEVRLARWVELPIDKDFGWTLEISATPE